MRRKAVRHMPAAGIPRSGAAAEGVLPAGRRQRRSAQRALLGGQIDVVFGSLPNMPAHMQSGRIRAISPTHVSVSVPSVEKAAASIEPVPLAERSRWGAKLAAGEIVTTVEIVPPRGVDPTKMLDPKTVKVVKLVLAVVLLHERLRPVQITGVVLATLGVVLAAPTAVSVAADSVSEANLAAWSAEEYAVKSCSSAGLPMGTSFMLGRVVMPDGRSATGAEWTIHDAGGQLLADGGRTGSDGLIHWCEAWPGEAVRVSAQLRGMSAASTFQLEAGLTVFRLLLERR